MLTKEDFKKVKRQAKLEIALLEQEYQDILHNVDSTLYEEYGILDHEETRELTRKRKNRRYASMIIELCAIMEQMLNQLYKHVYQKKFNSTQLMKTPAYRARSNMEIIQAELNKEHIALKFEKEHFADALSLVFLKRNKLVHENFSLVTIVKDGSNEEETFEELLHTVKKYRKHLQYNRPE
ncbi:hypothetical protein C0Q44_15245 [Paenibacillus sp. PCH8]|uniref:hypothetical protein n=1 Tax=Paenibacillus sp. PCH8 TaxID=2066524 RepID=UPI000CF8BFC6|nr:hypothetical protein [Paenibacillus sp. PCH8]PQP82748.1 hypothetical protein C0Q44_15245 [Paenibacillus sp. PCH8]